MGGPKTTNYFAGHQMAQSTLKMPGENATVGSTCGSGFMHSFELANGKKTWIVPPHHPAGTGNYPKCDSHIPSNVATLLEFYQDKGIAPPPAIQAIFDTQPDNERRSLQSGSDSCMA